MKLFDCQNHFHRTTSAVRNTWFTLCSEMAWILLWKYIPYLSSKVQSQLPFSYLGAILPTNYLSSVPLFKLISFAHNRAFGKLPLLHRYFRFRNISIYGSNLAIYGASHYIPILYNQVALPLFSLHFERQLIFRFRKRKRD